MFHHGCFFGHQVPQIVMGGGFGIGAFGNPSPQEQTDRCAGKAF
jgi:hypothetical protein